MRKSFRQDTPARLLIAFFVFIICLLLSLKALNILLIMTSYFWTQFLCYGQQYRQKPFRPSFARLVMEVHWIIEKIEDNSEVKSFFFAPFYYFPPVIFCSLLAWLSYEGSFFAGLFGAFLGGMTTYFLKVKKLYVPTPRPDKTALDFESEVVGSEEIELAQNHQKDSEKDL